ncbi:MAG: hypothetical protein ACRDD6_01755 [Tannerellaceae bacterium]
MKKVITTLFAAIAICSSAQENEKFHIHEHGQNEIGLSFGPSYSFEHNEWKASAHLHYFRSIKPESKWALGGSLESVFGEGQHYNVSAGVKYTPIPHIHVAIMPGVNFTKENHNHTEELAQAHHNQFKAAFAVHGEIVADLLIIGKFHVGPTLDFSWSKGHTHIMPGLHTAYSF